MSEGYSDARWTPAMLSEDDDIPTPTELTRPIGSDKAKAKREPYSMTVGPKGSSIDDLVSTMATFNELQLHKIRWKSQALDEALHLEREHIKHIEYVILMKLCPSLRIRAEGAMVFRFPWKKKKGKTRTRISDFVKLQFRRRKNAASPLVFETSFPTSLVDLIVNYRDRFKIRPPSPSPPLRSKKKTPHPPLLLLTPPQIEGPVSVSPPEPLPLPPPPGDQEIQSRIRRGGLKPNEVSVVVLKVFLICVLAMGTKKLTLGITISATLLYFLEFLVNHLSRFLRIQSNVRTKMVRPVFEDPSQPEKLSRVECDGRSNIIPEIKIDGKSEDMMGKDRCEKSHKVKIFRTKLKKILLPKKFRKKLEKHCKELGNEGW
ncbi:unnamed protein product [Cuscuta campestris]|uniref:Uncharacterized protein n=1 Tax=Cuscuta campestris TaxID=132261 RepID=A0A484K9N3_9ASTE|nr:unnamed protein product [Cuscuta campestris]